MRIICHSERSDKVKSYFPFRETKPNSHPAVHSGLDGWWEAAPRELLCIFMMNVIQDVTEYRYFSQI